MKKLAIAFSVLALSTPAFAEEVIDNVNVTQIGAYPHASAHYVWFTARSNECANTAGGVYSFDEGQAGGKGMLAMLTTALVNNRKVLVRSSGCAITEIYLR